MHCTLTLLALTAAAGGTGQPVVRTDVVLRWNEVMLQAVKADRTPPPMASRNMAIVHAAIYDAVNALDRTHEAFRVNALPEAGASAQAAAAVAAHRTLVSLYPRQVARFDAALDDTLAAVPDGPGKVRGMRLGKQVAEAILGWRRTDGARRVVRYTPGTRTGDWRPTPPGFRPGLMPQWIWLRPFCIARASDFRAEAPPPITSAAYTASFKEVKAVGGLFSPARTPEQTLIARFWDDGTGTVTPPGHWNRIAAEVARRRGNRLADNARMFALLNLALADAAIVAWDCKFKYSYWRPITGIHNADLDGNPDTDRDPAWTPLLTTPPFPSYTSGHSTFSGAAAAMLACFYGTDAVRFSSTSETTPGVVRHFASFSSAAAEAGKSRIYGGIHWEFDNQQGLAAGRAVGLDVCRTMLLPRGTAPVRTSAIVPAGPRR